MSNGILNVLGNSGGGSGGVTGAGTSTALFSSTASTTLVSSTTETTLIGSGTGTKTTPANYFSVGGNLVLDFEGFVSSAVTDTLTVKIKAGSTVVASTGAVALGVITTKVVRIRAVITCRTIGASGTFIVNTTTEVAGQADLQMQNSATVTLDTTGTLVWDITGQWSANSASDTITGTNFAMYTIGSATGGSASPAGTTGDIQINTAGAFAGLTPAAGVSTFLTTPSGANLATALTSALPATKGGTGLTSLGTGVATALGINVGSAGAPVVLNGAGGTPSAIALTNGTGLVATTGLTATGTKNSTTFLRGDDTWATPGGSGTVTVVGAGSLTTTALVTGGGTTTLQTPSPAATMDSSGNISTPGSVLSGSGASTAGALALSQGTTQSTGTTNIILQAPTSVTSYIRTLPAAVGTSGFVFETVAGSVQTESLVGVNGTGNVSLTTNPVFVTPTLGTVTSGNVGACTVDGTNLVGFLIVPSNSQSTAYTTVAADAGKSIDHPAGDANARTYTIAANASVSYAIGTCISFSNMTSQAVTIAINSDTLNLAGAGTTGSRTLAQYGVATARKVASTVWLINGTNLT